MSGLGCELSPHKIPRGFLHPLPPFSPYGKMRDYIIVMLVNMGPDQVSILQCPNALSCDRKMEPNHHFILFADNKVGLQKETRRHLLGGLKTYKQAEIL